MRHFLILLFSAVLGGCVVGPDYRSPEMAAPAAFAGGQAPQFTAGAVDHEFWKDFSDPLLDELVTQALMANHHLRIAAANLRRARALRGEARLDLGPTITAEGGYTEARASERQHRGTPAIELEDAYYEAAFDAVWELDVFGRVRRGLEARDAEVGAAAATLADAQVSVAAEVVRHYFELRGLQRQRAVAQRNAENQRSTLELTEVRLEAGIGTDLDTARARAQLSSTLASVPQLEAAIDRTIFRLGVLTGRQPTALLDKLTLSGALPALPSHLGVGTPEALLRHRPDVRVAERALAAATARIGLAVGDLFPKVTLLGRFGYDAADAGDLGEGASETYAWGPSISWAALDLGRVRQRIAGSRAAADGALARYEQVVLLALEDAESALTTYARARLRQAQLSRAAQASAQAAALARLRFDGGVADFLDVLDAERTLLEAESELARGDTELASALVAVYKALGGGLRPEWDVTLPRS